MVLLEPAATVPLIAPEMRTTGAAVPATAVDSALSDVTTIGAPAPPPVVPF
jgi:hypothetical protein